MKMYKSTILCLSNEGRLTLQVPQYTLEIGTSTRAEQPIDVPEDFLEELTVGDGIRLEDKSWYSRYRRTTPKEHGFWHLTRKGYEFFKADILAAYSRGNPKDSLKFEEFAEKHFQDVDACTQAYKIKEKAKLERRLKLIEAL